MHKIIHYFIALVWIVNGLCCKILNMEPRHQEIVGVILGTEYAYPLTLFIGILEIFMFVWILSGIKSKIAAVTQIAVIMAMNCIEFSEARHLLLFGKYNLLFAVLFCLLIYWNAFVSNKK